MKTRLRFPIRLKILVSLLFVVTAVVSAITFTMATLFHEDKTAYVKDLISLVGLSAAEECRSLLVGYGERLEVYSRILRDENLDREGKAQLLQGLFEDFPELIAVQLYRGGQEAISVYDARTLEAAGVTKEQLLAEVDPAALPLERIATGEVYLRNTSPSPSLPSMTLAVAPTVPLDEPPLVVAAQIRLNRVLRLASRFNAFDVSLIDAGGVLLAHRDPARVVARERADVTPESAGVSDRFSAGMTVEFGAEGQEMLAGFSRVDYGGVTTVAQIPKSTAYLASRSLLTRLLVVALLLLALAALVSLFWSRGLTRHVEALSLATREIAKGRFDIQVNANSRDEIGALAGSFNQMATELKDRDEALEGAQAQLVQSAKLAAFGQLGAGIAHEVKNPLAGIRGCAQLSLRKAEVDGPIYKNLKLIEKETKRCEAIIQNLLRFARQEQTVMGMIVLNDVVGDAVAIVHHHLELSRVHLEQDLADGLPLVRGNANQIQQVVMNLIMNAQQAMQDEPGTVRVSTRGLDDERVEIRVSDTGPGIPPELQDKIFDPFFTTKPSGEGTGLGLSVSFGIIQEHRGELRLESAPGQGTTFVITLTTAHEEATLKAGAPPTPAGVGAV